MASTLDLLKRLRTHGVEFVVVGGMAGVLHGSAMVTEDVDVCSPLSRENLVRILAALADLHPRLRMSPQNPPLPNNPDRLAGFTNLYLDTDLGQINFLSDIPGIGAYPDVLQQAVQVEIEGTICHILDLEALIRSRKALGRAKDMRVAAELVAIRRWTRGKNYGIR